MTGPSKMAGSPANKWPEIVNIVAVSVRFIYVLLFVFLFLLVFRAERNMSVTSFELGRRDVAMTRVRVTPTRRKSITDITTKTNGCIFHRHVRGRAQKGGLIVRHLCV